MFNQIAKDILNTPITVSIFTGFLVLACVSIAPFLAKFSILLTAYLAIVSCLFLAARIQNGEVRLEKHIKHRHQPKD